MNSPPSQAISVPYNRTWFSKSSLYKANAARWNLTRSSLIWIVGFLLKTHSFYFVWLFHSVRRRFWFNVVLANSGVSASLVQIKKIKAEITCLRQFLRNGVTDRLISASRAVEMEERQAWVLGKKRKEDRIMNVYNVRLKLSVEKNKASKLCFVFKKNGMRQSQ